MRLESYPVEKLKKEILAITGKYLDLEKYRIFFFGSRITGKGDSRSDIDIGIDGEKEISYDIISAIKGDIDKIITLYKIEVVDFKKVSEDFSKVALKKIEVIS